MTIDKPAPPAPAGATKNPANGTFTKVGPLPTGKTGSDKPADNKPKST
jgi:hypothetical protein